MTKERILEAAYEMASRDGFSTLTRDSVAAEAGTAKGAVNHHFKTIAELRDEVMRLAVQRTILAIIGNGLAMGDAVAKTAPDDIKREALNTLL